MSNSILLIPSFEKVRLRRDLSKKSPLIPFFQRGRIFFLFLSLLVPLQSDATVCSVSASPVNFGIYNVYAPGNTQTIGQITVTCDPVTTSYTVALNAGTYGTIAQRKQSSGSDFLLYNLYTDPARSILWGDGSTNGVTVSSSGLAPLNVYGNMPGQQNVTVGIYSDNVSVNVTF